MIKAVLRLVLISIATVSLAFLAVLTVRRMGQSQAYEPPSTGWFRQPFWWIYKPTPPEICQTKDLAQVVPSKDWIVIVPVERKDDTWFVPCTPQIAFADFLHAHPEQHNWLMELKVHDTWSLDQLIDQVHPFESDNQFGVMTEAQKINIYLRKKAPEWLFAADSSSLLRFRMYESMWVETAFEFWPDFVVTSADPHSAFYLDARGAEELHRRQKRVIWNWDENPSAEPHVPIQGVMTNRPSAAQQKFGQRL